MKLANITKKIELAAAAAVLVFSVTAAPVLAATDDSKGGGQALEIAPPLMNLKADPGQTINTQIKLRDVAATPLVVTNQINDFVAGGEEGTPKILFDNPTNNPYSMHSWIVPLPQLNLEPKQIKTLDVTINVPKNASPGGHYAVIRFTGAPPQLNSTGLSQVGLSASLGSLILLTVSGQLTENLDITGLSVSQDGDTGWFFRKTPLTFTEQIKNSGNVQEQPTGTITITNMFGKTVAAMQVNQPPHNILPSSTRKFDQKLDESVIGNKHFFGRYTAEVKISYGQNHTVITKKVSFWVIPWILILVIIAVLIALFFIFRFFLRRYKRRIISQAGNPTDKK